MRRVEYSDGFAGAVATWATDPTELTAWASRTQPVDAAVLRQWSETAGVTAHVFLEDGAPCAYGEIWEDPDEQEAELAHIIVAPTHRRRGVGGAVARALASEARRRGYANVWLRVAPANRPALQCYAKAGFVRASLEQEARFNVGQPQAYVWMSAGDGLTGSS